MPSSAFSFDPPLAQRDVTTGGAAGMIAKRVRQMEGVIGWSECVQSGAAIIGPFASSNIQIWQDTNLPPVTWQPETGAVVPSADPTASRQVNDGRVFCGVFEMMAIATWGAGNEGDFAVDLVIDPYTQAVNQKVAITISMFCDVGTRWPAAFAYTAAGVS